MTAATIGAHMPARITLDVVAAMAGADERHRYELSREGVLTVMPPSTPENILVVSRLIFWFFTHGYAPEQVTAVVSQVRAFDWSMPTVVEKPEGPESTTVPRSKLAVDVIVSGVAMITWPLALAVAGTAWAAVAVRAVAASALAITRNFFMMNFPTGQIQRLPDRGPVTRDQRINRSRLRLRSTAWLKAR